MKVLVTGAGGFVGGTIVEALYFAKQHNVIAGVRDWGTGTPRIARLGVDIVRCDIFDRGQLAQAVQGVDCVIHCALGHDIAEGTANVLHAARESKVKRVVHLSSVAIYGGAEGLVTETTVAPPRSLNAYGTAKLQAELECQKAVSEGLEVVILRPTLIYGQFSSLWTMLYATRLQTGRWADLGDAASGKCNLVHVNDVARFAITAMTGEGLSGEAFNINGPEIITWNEYFRTFNDHLGLPPLQPLSPSRTRLMAQLTKPLRIGGKFAIKHYSSQLTWLSHKSSYLRRAMKNAELTMRCAPNAEELGTFRQDVTYVTRKAEYMFGMRPKVGVQEGLAMSVAWLKHMGEAV